MRFAGESLSTSRLILSDLFSKTYTTENAYRSHINSKKHKENEVKLLKARASASSQQITEETQSEVQPTETVEPSSLATITEKLTVVTLTVDAEASEAEVNQTIDEKIAAARSKLQPTQCLFCADSSTSLEDNLTHMSSVHSFFVPDADYLVNITGLIAYLGEKIAVGNVCIYCNGRGREFRTLDAVRKHMVDKVHCKIAYDTESDRLEISDYYDFSSSYPDARRRKKSKKVKVQDMDEDDSVEMEDDGWEDDDEVDDDDVDEVVQNDEKEESDEESDEAPDNQITYGDSHYELVLPSGARIGHRSMRRYYAQSFRPIPTKPDDPNSGAALVRRLIADRNSALVPRRGGFGAFGSGTDVVKARNRGEAREAGKKR